MLYIEYDFHQWLADVGPTLARRSKSRWPNVGSQRRTDGCADVGPMVECYLGIRNHPIRELTRVLTFNGMGKGQL